ncbi:MAG: hypothetical protein ACLPXB_15615 [Thiobacillaceae bacterium]
MENKFKDDELNGRSRRDETVFQWLEDFASSDWHAVLKLATASTYPLTGAMSPAGARIEQGLQSAAIGDSTEVGLHPEEISDGALQVRLRRLALLPRGRVELRLTIHPSRVSAVT